MNLFINGKLVGKVNEAEILEKPKMPPVCVSLHLPSGDVYSEVTRDFLIDACNLALRVPAGHLAIVYRRDGMPLFFHQGGGA